MDMSSAPADAGQEQDLSGGEGEQLQRLAWTAQKSAHACAAFLWCRPTSPDRVRPPGAVVGDAQTPGDVGAVGTHWRPPEAAFGADVGSIATRDTYLHRFSGTWRARLPSASRCARLPGEPRRAPHAPPLCGSPTSTAQLVSPAHVRISRPDNFPHSSPGQAHTMRPKARDSFFSSRTRFSAPPAAAKCASPRRRHGFCCAACVLCGQRASARATWPRAALSTPRASSI